MSSFTPAPRIPKPQWLSLRQRVHSQGSCIPKLHILKASIRHHREVSSLARTISACASAFIIQQRPLYTCGSQYYSCGSCTPSCLLLPAIMEVFEHERFARARLILFLPRRSANHADTQADFLLLYPNPDFSTLGVKELSKILLSTEAI